MTNAAAEVAKTLAAVEEQQRKALNAILYGDDSPPKRNFGLMSLLTDEQIEALKPARFVWWKPWTWLRR